jgi:hypothetical protein
MRLKEMNVAFITNDIKTKFFYEISRRLETNQQFCVYWLSPSHLWSRWLLLNNISSNKILDLTAYKDNWKNVVILTADHLSELESLENENGLKINDIILMDRNLREKPYQFSLAYLFVCMRKVKEFLIKNQIRVVFCEQTWAFEIITSLVCKQLGIDLFSPHTVRIPDGRFSFFEGHLQKKLFSHNEPKETHLQAARDYHKAFLINKPKPKYWHLNNKIPNVELKWVWKLIKHLYWNINGYYNHDETRPKITKLVKKKLLNAINNKMISLFNPFETPNNNGKQYVLYALHKQPEASIDVLGSYFSNQYELIKTLARTLPINFELFVKEHRNSLGDSPIQFYKQLKSIPSVKLIDPYVDSHELIKNAQLVLTVSGTVAYEASLFGVPALTMSDMFFKSVLYKERFNPYVDSLSDILKSNQFVYSDEKIINFIALVIANSFEGTISDPKSDPSCIEDKNLDKVVIGFESLLRLYQGG